MVLVAAAVAAADAAAAAAAAASMVRSQAAAASPLMTQTRLTSPKRPNCSSDKDHIIRYGIFSSLDLELLIELNLHKDHRLRWTRMAKYYYYFDILNLIVAFGHDEL